MRPDCKMGKPCGSCPFRRTIRPGQLGGSLPTVYIGQTLAGMRVPCHETIDYKLQDWKAQVDNQQCAGMAIFRGNLGLEGKLPEGIHVLPADESLVFPDFVSFLSHHMQVPPVAARFLLAIDSPEKLAAEEFAKGRILAVPNGE